MGAGEPVSETARPEVAFCVWALRQDGLRAGPFDRHPPGTGTLRAAGIDATTWERWLRAVVGAQERLGTLAPDFEAAPADALRRAARAAADPSRFAPPRARGVIARMWEAYRGEGRAWRRAAQRGLLTHLPGQELQALLRPLADVGPIQIYLAEYEVPRALAVAPRTIVLGVPALDRGTARLSRDVILEAAVINH